MRKNHATFANFICKFGELNLLDYAEEIVIPAFTKKSQIRRWGSTAYLLLKVRVENIEIDDVERAVIFGTFVKDSHLRREQILDSDGELKASAASIQSSPSSFFVLFLDNHRLGYYSETDGAPDLRQFESAMRHFLKIEWRKYCLRALEEDLSLPQEPNLQLVPIVTNSSIDDFISQYKIIKSLTITVLATNDDVDVSELMNDVRAYNEKVGGPSSKLVTAKPSGLIGNGVSETLKEISQGSNQAFQVSGVGQNDERLTGDNDNMSLQIAVDKIPSHPVKKAKFLGRKLSELANSGLIKLPRIHSATKKRANDVVLKQ